MPRPAAVQPAVSLESWVADPHHLLQIQIHLFSLMRTRFRPFTLMMVSRTDVMRTCHHWSRDPLALCLEPPRLYCEALQHLNFDITVVRIRIWLFTQMLIRTELPNIMWIHADTDPRPC
jgi:hypothetical protein